MRISSESLTDEIFSWDCSELKKKRRLSFLFLTPNSKMKTTFLLAIVVALSLVVSVCAVTDEEQWSDFKKEFGKRFFDEAEEAKRFKIFVSNLRKAEALTERSPSAKFGVTRFMDLTVEEFRQQFLRLDPDSTKRARGTMEPFAFEESKPHHENVDWRDKKHNPKNCLAVTTPRDQGQCGSCWAMAIAEALEGCHMIKKCDNKIVYASPQQVMDCCTEGGSDACNGGDPSLCLEWATHHDIATEESYRYHASKGKCKNATQVLCPAGECRFIAVPEGNETALQISLLQAPVSIAIVADILQTYMSGVIGGPDCNGGEVDHAVLLTTLWDDIYTVSPFRFFLSSSRIEPHPKKQVKNSWGLAWGMNGYFMMSADQNCLKLTTLATLAVPRDGVVF